MSIPRYWRDIPQRYRLEASRCEDCGTIQIPTFSICPKCNSNKIKIEQSPSMGKIITYTIVYVPPAKFAGQSPYGLGIIELENGVRVTAQITDCDHDKIKSGMKVQAVFRRINADGETGIIQYGYKFRPLNLLKSQQKKK